MDEKNITSGVFHTIPDIPKDDKISSLPTHQVFENILIKNKIWRPDVISILTQISSSLRNKSEFLIVLKFASPWESGVH